MRFDQGELMDVGLHRASVWVYYDNPHVWIISSVIEIKNNRNVPIIVVTIM